MDRYLIETPHTAQECSVLVDQVRALGYLFNFDWGCNAGEHSGWAIVAAENEQEARMAVPPFVRAKARVVRLNKFETVNQSKQTHLVSDVARRVGPSDE